MSGIFGDNSAPAAPKVPDPTPLPDSQGPEVMAARRKALADAAARGGRASTIMGGSMTDAPLGGAASAPAGDSYSNTTLGGGR